MKPEERDQLIDEVLDGICSEADFLRLEAELHVDPAARQAYYDRLKLDTLLQINSEQLDRKNIIAVSFVKKRLPIALGIAAAILLFAGTIGWQIGRSGNSAGIAQTEPVAKGFGVVSEQSNAVWKDTPLNRGDLLPPGDLQLQEGLVQLELFSGVTIIVEGESQFALNSAMEMTVKSGKFRAVVPKPARGFRIHTETGDVVDLGTEFAIDVTEQHADLHVVDGEIEWHPVARPVKHLIEGQSLRWNEDGKIGEAPPGLDQFAGIDQLNNLRLQKREAWKAYSNGQLKNDPRLLAYYPIAGQNGTGRQISDQSGSGNDGVIVRTKRSSDRWDEPNQAIEFSPTGSRVRVNIPGEHSALTLYCWIRIDSLDKWYNSLFLTDGHELNEPHWQIMDDGRLFFSVKARTASKGKTDKHIAYSPPVWTPDLSGQWIQVASVYSSASKSTTHYLNGKQISRDILPDDLVVEKVRIGAASIGNWSEPQRKDPHFAVRNVNGAIDEFAIFSTALTATEIAELYERGKP